MSKEGRRRKRRREGGKEGREGRTESESCWKSSAQHPVGGEERESVRWKRRKRREEDEGGREGGRDSGCEGSPSLLPLSPGGGTKNGEDIEKNIYDGRGHVKGCKSEEKSEKVGGGGSGISLSIQ